VPTGTPDLIYVRPVAIQFLPAFAQIGAAGYSWDFRLGSGSFFCVPNPQRPSDERCYGETSSAGLSGRGTASVPESFGSGYVNVTPSSTGTRISYRINLTVPGWFVVYDAAGRAIDGGQFSPAIVVAPEPATIALTGLGVLGLGGLAARRRRA
jgi:hypothetical protein